MKNTQEALNNYLFECIERLNDEDLQGEAFEREVQRSDAIQKVAKMIIENSALALKVKMHFDEYDIPRDVQIPLIGTGDEQ